jgi:predicted permease
MGQDLRRAWATIRSNPLLALSSVLTLTLGIGLNAGVFTVVDGLLFRARVQKDPETFVHLSPSYRGAAAGQEAPWSISTRDYRTLAAEARTLRNLAGWGIVRVAAPREEAQLALAVTCNFFELYGLERPVLGSTFTGAECATPGLPLEAVIGEELWRGRYNGDPHIIGKVVRWNGLAVTIVGVVPAGYPGRLRGPGIWLPWTAQATLYPSRDQFATDGARWLTVEGRLVPGRTRGQARSELQVIVSRLDRLEPGRTTTIVLTNGSFGEEPAVRAQVFWIGSLIMGGLTLILLIACTNVAILQLSRAVERQREMAIRLAMGAGKWRLSRMLLAETLLMALLAGGASVAVAYAAPGVFAKLLPTSSTPVYPLQPDGAVLAYLGAAVLLTTCFAGLSPAAESLRVNLAASMKGGDGWSGAGGASLRGHGLLVSAQVAMCLVVLVTAGLFLRAQQRAALADPGFEARHVLLVPANGSAVLMDSLRAVPSVEVVAAGSALSGSEVVGDAAPVRVPREGWEERKAAEITSVSPDFFVALGIPLVRGRVFGEPDEVVVSEALARAFWPGEDPLGKRLVLTGGSVLVAGVSRDLRVEHPGVMDAPHVYRRHDPRTPPDTLTVRFVGDVEPVQAAVRAELERAGIQSFGPPKTLRAILDEGADRLKELVDMVEVVAAMALALAVLGIYGVVALAVRRRTRELGIRMALGATKRRIIGSVLSLGLRPVAWGIGIGLPLAAGAARAVAAVLQRTPIPIVVNDVLLYVAVMLLLAGVGLTAMLVPASRASATGPMTALRQD